MNRKFILSSFCQADTANATHLSGVILMTWRRWQYSQVHQLIQCIPSRLSAGHSVEGDKLILKFTWNCKGPQQPKWSAKRTKRDLSGWMRAVNWQSVSWVLSHLPQKELIMWWCLRYQRSPCHCYRFFGSGDTRNTTDGTPEWQRHHLLQSFWLLKAGQQVYWH